MTEEERIFKDGSDDPDSAALAPLADAWQLDGADWQATELWPDVQTRLLAEDHQMIVGELADLRQEVAALRRELLLVRRELTARTVRPSVPPVLMPQTPPGRLPAYRL